MKQDAPLLSGTANKERKEEEADRMLALALSMPRIRNVAILIVRTVAEGSKWWSMDGTRDEQGCRVGRKRGS